jgi:lysine 6-dehydrogenase
MNVLILGAGMMGRAIAYDLAQHAAFDHITLTDKNTRTLKDARVLLKHTTVDLKPLDITNRTQLHRAFKNADIAVSAVPYYHNLMLAKTAIQTTTHFIDLGGNNDIVTDERTLHPQAQKNHVTIIPDSGLAPGLVSIITRDIVETLDTVDTVTLRVGGLPVHPQPPLNYQLVFSPQGLINEYAEDAIILDHGHIITKPSMTQLETIRFPPPFGTMEAFLTSGGCSTLPTTYQHKIKYLDYKTIRYPGHCHQIKTLLDLGFADTTPHHIGPTTYVPRDLLIHLLQTHLPTQGDDVVLLKVTGTGTKNHSPTRLTYTLIDYADTHNHISAMMRTTGYPVAITASFIQQGLITQHGVYCPEEIVPFTPMRTALKQRHIHLHRTMKTLGD